MKDCAVSPEVTQGPYYHDAGHPIRQNMAENQLGLLFVRSALPSLPESKLTSFLAAHGHRSYRRQDLRTYSRYPRRHLARQVRPILLDSEYSS